MKTIHTGTDNFKAALVKGLLEDAGIESYMVNENINNILPYSSAIVGMELQIVVSDDDYDRALDVLGIGNEAEHQ